MMTTIQTFLESKKSKGTRLQYKCSLNQFFEKINKNPEDYFKEDQTYKQDVLKYFQYLQNIKSNSIYSKLTAVKMFFNYYKKWHDIPIPEIPFEDILKNVSTKRVSIKRTLTKQQLKEILTHATAKEKALFLTALTTGLRISELLSIRLKDVDLSKSPMPIEIRATDTKTGNPRIVFTTEEAKQAIKEWLKIREDYIHSKRHRGMHLKGHEINPRDKVSLFPYKKETASQMWRTLTKKAGYNQKDKVIKNRQVYTIHSLRRYFRNTIGRVIDSDIAEILIGHQSHNETKHAYLDYTEQQLAEEYKKAMPKLNIFDTDIDIDEIKQDQEFLDRRVNRLYQENKILKEQINVLMKFIESQNKGKTINDFLKELYDKDNLS